MTVSLTKCPKLLLHIRGLFGATVNLQLRTKLKMEGCDYKTGLSSEYLDVSGVETHVVKYGTVDQSEGSRRKGKQLLFLVIPDNPDIPEYDTISSSCSPRWRRLDGQPTCGNPGIPEYYQQFMHTLWERSGRTAAVWCVGHVGHVTGPGHPGLGWTDIVRQPEQVYTLEGQISHKVDFIRHNVPPDVTLCLIGHSIGCYMILNLLPRIPQFHVLRCFLLFPTIERMAQTPNGRVLTPVFSYLRWLLVGFVKVLSYLDPSLHRKMVEYHFSKQKVPECGVTATLNLFNPACVNHSTYMARLEMEEVGELQEELLRQHVDKLSLYYGAVDRWCPPQYCRDLRSKVPHADVRLCQMDFSHAFVLDAGQEMAGTVWDWLQKYL